MSRLFETLQLGDLRLDNRIIIAPMCQYSARDGAAGDWHMIHLGHLALSGAGLMILEATAVSPEGRISPFDLGLYSDDDEAALSRVLAAIREFSPIALAVQLSHAGRKGSTRPPWEGGAQIAPSDPMGWRTLAPSAVAHAEGGPRAACSRPLRPGCDPARVRGRGEARRSAGPRWNRDPRRSWLPAASVSLSARQQAHGRVWRLA